MGLLIEPTIGLPFPTGDESPAEELEFRERAHVLCRTVLTTYGGQDGVEITAADEREAAHMFSTGTIPVRPAPRPGGILKLEALLTEYDYQVVGSAVQVRTYVTNRLLEESTHPDAKIRMKALELLGKIGDVGLFAEKIEVSIQQRNSDEIETLLKEKLERFGRKLLDSAHAPASKEPPTDVVGDEA